MIFYLFTVHVTGFFSNSDYIASNVMIWKGLKKVNMAYVKVLSPNSPEA
jgi:hypothetical protein